MKIAARKVAPDVYALRFDDTEVAIDGEGVKTLLTELTRVIAPTGRMPRPRPDVYRDFLRHMRSANDLGIEALLRAAAYNDTLILFKQAEGDQTLIDRFYANMSERSAKMIAEDLAYQFKDGVPEDVVDGAMRRIMATARNLRDDGLLQFENVAQR